jgi:hypothetical protein
MNPTLGRCARQAIFHVHREDQRARPSEVDLVPDFVRAQCQRRRKTELIAAGAAFANGAGDDAGERLTASLDASATNYRNAARRIVADRASRANVPFALSRPSAAYAGVYENALWGRIEIRVQDSTLRVACGVLRAIAEPLAKPDAVWVELQPGEGAALQFEGDGGVPASLTLAERRFQRLA